MSMSIITYDEAIVNGKLVKGDSAGIVGMVEVIYEGKGGRSVFTRNLYTNDLLVNGAVFMSEKINNIRSTFRTTPIDVELGVHTADELVVDTSTIPNEKICGLMVGTGGTIDTYNSVRKVNRAARIVPDVVPFRVVPVGEDLSPTDRVKYILRVQRGEYIYYYGKKFDIEREINVQFSDGTTVPLNVDTLNNPKFIRTFTKYQVVVDSRDIREYFKYTEGSTINSMINSLGLITGYPGVSADNAEEFFNVRGMTTLNMENHELKDSESTITVIYRLFIV